MASLTWRLHLPRLIGWACFTIALLTDVSDGYRLLGRWPLTVVLGILSALPWFAAAWNSWRSYRFPAARPESGSSAGRLVEGAVLCWGVGYLLGAWDAPGDAGNVYRLNLFGSRTPATITLYWFALAALFFAAVVWLRRRVAARWVNLGTSLATVGLLCLVGEGVVRAKDLLAPATQGFPTYDSILWARRYVRLNHRGFRDTEHSLVRVPGTKRVLLIGDSFAFGAGIRLTGGRLGEQLAVRLDSATRMSWEVINASHPDLHTLNEIAILDSTITYRPDVVILEYVFNDIDYLYPVTARDAITYLPRLHPARLLFWNSFLFQEAYVQVRAIHWSSDRGPSRYDPYADTSLVVRHLGDLAKFVAAAESAGAVVGIVPVDPRVVVSPVARRRYDTFIGRALAAGLPIWRVDSTFNGLTMRQLTVNRLDGHPGELANELVAREMWPKVISALQQHGQQGRPSRAAVGTSVGRGRNPRGARSDR